MIALDHEYLKINSVFIYIIVCLPETWHKHVSKGFHNLFTKCMCTGAKWNQIEVFRVYLLNYDFYLMFRWNKICQKLPLFSLLVVREFKFHLYTWRLCYQHFKISSILVISYYWHVYILTSLLAMPCMCLVFCGLQNVFMSILVSWLQCTAFTHLLVFFK